MRYLFILLTFAGLQAFSQSYTVIHTIGKIYDSNTGQYLTKGSKVAEDANLRFETAGAKAAVLSSSRGRFVIQQNATSSTQSDALYALTSVISPVRGRLSTRSVGINNALDLQKHFNEGSVALVGPTYQVAVSPLSYPMSDSKFFYAQYQYNGETINKKLDNDGNNLIINISNFYAIDDAPIDPTLVEGIKLFFYSVEDQTSEFITDMNLVVVSDEALTALMQDEEATLDLINSLYGKCSEEQLQQAIESRK